jgi:hypothetical protein
MADAQVITKRVAITKANAQIIIIVGVAAFVTIFSLVASHALWSQNSYQAKVTSAQQIAHQQLLKNIQTYNSLESSYQAFVTAPNNVIGGSTSGTGDNDGSNASIILDSLPPSYDFPALTSSIENILTSHGLNVTDISGTDDQVDQQSNTNSPNPQPVSMPFAFTISNANYSSVGQLITLLGQSIRPIQIDTIDLSGASSDMTLTVNAHTYYQPGKTVNISKQVIQ